MPRYRVYRDWEGGEADYDDHFLVEANDPDDAIYQALRHLGWEVCSSAEEEKSDEEEKDSA